MLQVPCSSVPFARVASETFKRPRRLWSQQVTCISPCEAACGAPHVGEAQGEGWARHHGFSCQVDWVWNPSWAHLFNLKPGPGCCWCRGGWGGFSRLHIWKKWAKTPFKILFFPRCTPLLSSALMWIRALSSDLLMEMRVWKYALDFTRECLQVMAQRFRKVNGLATLGCNLYCHHGLMVPCCWRSGCQIEVRDGRI